MALARVGCLQACALCALVLVACQSATHVGGYSCYPDRADRANAEYCLWVDIEGGSGRAFVERGRKTIRLSILTAQEEVVLEREYTAEAGDLSWLSTWPDLSDLRIVFFEYAEPRTPEEKALGAARIPRQVLSVAFTFGPVAGAFVEALAPRAVLEEASRRDDLKNSRHIVEIFFIDSEESQTRILESIRELAASRGLEAEEQEAGIIGRLAEYSGPSFSLAVKRHTSLGQLAVTMEDHGNRELTEYLAGELRGLPGVLGTRRHVSVNFRLGPQDLEAVVRSVGEVARKYGLSRSDGQETSELATYAASGLELTITHFEGEGRVEISLEDSAWNPRFQEIESALRDEFGAAAVRG